MLKITLKKINQYLIYQNSREKASIWSFIHRWNYEHSLVKNLLSVSNNILKSINKYHIFRWDWMIVVLGGTFGYVLGEMQNFYFQQKMGYKPMMCGLVDQYVLKNKIVEDKLKQVITNNVCLNAQLQFYVHQTLLNQVLDPNKDKIKQIITDSCKYLDSHQTHKTIAKIVSQNIQYLQNPIKQSSLAFLNGEQMDRICASSLSSVLQSLYIKYLIANTANQTIKYHLSNDENRSYVYEILREKIII